MPSLLAVLVATSALAALSDGAGPVLPVRAAAQDAERIVSVRFKGQHVDGPARLAGMAADEGSAPWTLVRSNRLGILDVAMPPGTDPAAVAERLGTRADVDFAEVGQYGHFAALPDDSTFGEQWALHNTGQSGGLIDADVDAPEAWEIEDGDPSIVVAIIDSGIDWNHIDLGPALWTKVEPVNGLDDDGNGFIDDFHGWDFWQDDKHPMDALGHGTSVAGVVAAVGGNGHDLAGLAGGAVDGQGCRVMALRVGNQVPDGTLIDDAILYAVDNGARIIVLSLFGPRQRAIELAFEEARLAGVMVFAAAGNTSTNVAWPARHPAVIAVGATDDEDERAWFSAAGPELELVAPGRRVTLLLRGGGTWVADGTSFAAPLAAAAAALLFSAEPDLSREGARSLLHLGADDLLTPGFDLGTGHGRLNAHRSLLTLRSAVIGSVTVLGDGLPGGQGAVPELVVEAPPHVGEEGYRIALAQARPHALAWLLVGTRSAALAFAGGTLYVDPSAPSARFVRVITDVAGTAEVRVPLPADDSLIGLVWNAQWIVQDHGASTGWALSPGWGLTIGL